jgi:3-oxoacyl-[acyl-carrier-protein] synthase-3
MVFSYQQVCIESLGYTLPASSVSSAEIEEQLTPLYQRLKLPFGRLALMTGIESRRFWPVGTAISDISISSCNRALAAANFDRTRIGLLVHGSVCRDHLEPATACRVHHRTGLPASCQVYDVSNACLGILNGMLQAANMIELGQIEAALVVGSENGRGLVESTMKQLNRNEWLTRKTIKNSIASLTIGSASCAVLLTHASISQSKSHLIGGTVTANTQFSDLCQSLSDQAGDGMAPLMETDSGTLMMEGIETGRKTFDRFLDQFQWRRDNIAQTVCHQVGSVHRRLMLESIAIDPGRDFSTFPWLGNTGSAALPVTFAKNIEENRLSPGDQVALLGIGSGINCIVLGTTMGATPCFGTECDQFLQEPSQ